MTQRHPETAVEEWWESKVDWQGSGDACEVPFRAGEEEPVKGPATGEKGASHGPLCMNAPTSRPVSPAPAISLPPDPFSLPSPRRNVCLCLCTSFTFFHLCCDPSGTSDLQTFPYHNTSLRKNSNTHTNSSLSHCVSYFHGFGHHFYCQLT